MAPIKNLLAAVLSVVIPSVSFASPLSEADSALWLRLRAGLQERGMVIRAPSEFLPAFKAFVLEAGDERRYATLDPASGQAAFLDTACDLSGDCAGADVHFLLANEAGELETGFLLKDGSVEPVDVFSPDVRARFEARRRLWLDFAKGLPRDIAAGVEKAGSFRRLKGEAGTSGSPAVRASALSVPAPAAFARAAAAAPAAARKKVSPPLRRGFKSLVSALLAGKAAHDVGTFLLAAGTALTQWLAPGSLGSVDVVGNAAMWAMIAGVVGYSFYKAWKSDTSVVDWVKGAVRSVLGPGSERTPA